jgi:hypothetical protein
MSFKGLPVGERGSCRSVAGRCGYDRGIWLTVGDFGKRDDAARSEEVGGQ